MVVVVVVVVTLRDHTSCTRGEMEPANVSVSNKPDILTAFITGYDL